MKTFIAAARAAVSVFRIRLSGEPIFVLRAQDKLAEKTVRDWASRVCYAAPDGQVAAAATKAVGAQAIADAMRAWPTKKFPD